MKKQLLLKPLLTLALVMICGSAWAETYTRTITFKTAESDSNTATSDKTTLIESGSGYVSSLTGSENLYVGTNGVKLGSSKKTGTLALSVDLGSEKVSKITVASTKYNTDTGTLSFSANEEEIGSGKTPGEEFSYVFTNPISLSKLTIQTSSKRAYVSSIVFETTTEAPDVDVTGVTLTESIELIEGNTSTLVATVAPTGATNKNVTWESSNESVATVDADGKVTAVAEGTATITVTTVDGGFTDTCIVTVCPKPSVNANSVITFDAFSTFTGGSGYKTLDDYKINGIGGFQVTDCMLSSNNLQMKASSGKLVSPVIKSECGFDVYVTYKSEAKMTLKIGSEDAVSDGSVLKASTNSTSASFTLTVGNKFATIEKIVILPKHNVTISAAKYATLCLPFNFTVPEDVTAYTGEATNDGVTLTPIEGVIPANTGVIIYSETPGIYTFTGSAETHATIVKNDLVGVTETTTIPEGSYILALDDTDNTAKFFEIDPSDKELAAYKAYLTIPDGITPNKALAIRRGDATGIRTIEAQAANQYFDLMGRKVQNPERGIYILNGKKVYVK